MTQAQQQANRAKIYRLLMELAEAVREGLDPAACESPDPTATGKAGVTESQLARAFSRGLQARTRRKPPQPSLKRSPTGSAPEKRRRSRG